VNNRDLVERDLRVVWHPCTQMKDHEQWPPVPVRRARGVWLEDFDGNRYIDAISSWWVNLFGHANSAINQAVRAQLDELEHVLLAGFTHEPVVRLSERLVGVAPAGLARCFYADNGSSAIEVALKMSFHYWRNAGESGRTRFVSLANSYHGETLGALAMGDVPLYKSTYGPLLLENIVAPSPDAYAGEPGEDPAACAHRAADALERLLAQNAGQVCAVLVEPLVQCAGGMRMHDPVYLRLLRAACDRHRVHLIADEIATGFGRTGTMFACEQGGIAPDFLCVGKGLTGGYLPLAAVLTTDAVYSAFYDEYSSLRAFLHSHSYTGNPLACAAALATLDLFDGTDTLAANRRLSDHMARACAGLAAHPHVADVRQRGMILAIEMAPGGDRQRAYPWQERRGMRVYRHALGRQCLLRPLGNVIYFMPPYVIMPGEIDHLATVAAEGIDLATRE